MVVAIQGKKKWKNERLKRKTLDGWVVPLTQTKKVE